MHEAVEPAHMAVVVYTNLAIVALFPQYVPDTAGVKGNETAGIVSAALDLCMYVALALFSCFPSHFATVMCTSVRRYAPRPTQCRHIVGSIDCVYISLHVVMRWCTACPTERADNGCPNRHGRAGDDSRDSQHRMGQRPSGPCSGRCAERSDCAGGAGCAGTSDASRLVRPLHSAALPGLYITAAAVVRGYI